MKRMGTHTFRKKIKTKSDNTYGSLLERGCDVARRHIIRAVVLEVAAK
jgi:hypothetical protein